MSSQHLHQARLIARRVETPTLLSLRFEVPPPVAAAYTTPGQFIEVRLPGEEDSAYFALANAPGAGHFELLAKRLEGVASSLWALEVGATLLITEPMGEGFPLQQARGRDVLLFATGSGFAPIRATLQAILSDREAYEDVHLFFGVRTEEDFPFKAELEALGDHRVETHLTVSRKPEPGTGHGRYVQERFRHVLPRVENAEAYLCGIEGMIEGVTETLSEVGMAPTRIHLNQ